MSKNPRSKINKGIKRSKAARGEEISREAATTAWNAYHQNLRAEKQTAHALWTDMWSAVDFSWAGLTDGNWGADEPHAWSFRANDAHSWQIFKRWHAPLDFPSSAPIRGTGGNAFREATLQDYWRWVPNEGSNIRSWADGRLASDEELEKIGLLVRRDGALWHAVHHPFCYGPEAADPLEPAYHHYARDADGQKVLGEAIAYRMMLSAATTMSRSGWGDVFLSGPDNRLQLSGTRSYLATAFRSVIDKITDPHERKIQLRAPMAEFRKNALSDLSFGPSSDLRCVYFRDGIDRCTFDDGTHFTFACFEGNSSDLEFHGYTVFQSTAFSDHGGLSNCKFGDAFFDEATFGHSVSFHRCTFQHGSFNNIAVEGSLRIFDAVFAEHFYASEQRCRGYISFNRSEFSDGLTLTSGRYEVGIALRDCRIKGKTFITVKFGGESAIVNNIFEDMFTFTSDLSEAGIDFGGSTFREKAIFRGFSKTKFGGRVSFRTAMFHELADFSDVQWPVSISNHQSAFEGTRFRGVANFKGKDFSAYAMFDGASLEGRILLAEPSITETSSDALVEQALKLTGEATRMDQRLFAENRETWEEGAQERGADARYGALAGGFRTLKRAMSHQGDMAREHRFYRFELMARQRIPSESGLFKVTNGIYRVMSDYGYSIIRPVLSIFFSLFIFWIIYYLISIKVEVFDWRSGDIGRAWAFSWRNSFLPFSLLNLPEISPTPSGGNSSLIPEAKLITGQLLKALGTLQSFISLLAVFLFGLALRRRFQIG